MDQPQPYLYDGIFYLSNKRTRTISPISKSNYPQKKNKVNENVNVRNKRILNDNILSNLRILERESKKIKIS